MIAGRSGSRESESVPTSRRSAVLAALTPLVGLVPADAAYKAVVYPFDAPGDVLAMSSAQSGCGLVTEVGWRAIGVDDPVFYLPYRERVAHGKTWFAVAAEYAAALRWGAWVAPTPTMPLPSPGDALIVGCQGCPGEWAIGGSAVQHECTVETVGKDDGKGIPITSIDGGQANKGVLRRQRHLVRDPAGIWWLADTSLGSHIRPAVAKRLFGYTNVDKLRVRSGGVASVLPPGVRGGYVGVFRIRYRAWSGPVLWSALFRGVYDALESRTHVYQGYTCRGDPSGPEDR